MALQSAEIAIAHTGSATETDYLVVPAPSDAYIRIDSLVVVALSHGARWRLKNATSGDGLTGQFTAITDMDSGAFRWEWIGDGLLRANFEEGVALAIEDDSSASANGFVTYEIVH